MLAETSRDVFYIHDHVAHNRGQGNRQPRQNHYVEGDIPCVEYDRCRQERRRDYRETDQHSAPLEEKEAKNGCREHRTDQQRRGEVVNRVFDIVGWPKDGSVDFDTLKAWAHILERRIYTSRHFQHICAREFFDNQ